MEDRSPSSASPRGRDLRSAAYSGGRWMAIQNVGLQALSLVTTAVLARTLSLSEFGLVAVVLVILSIFSLINQMGWGAALIVRADLTREAVSTMFWSSVVFGFASAGALTLFAQPLASLFGGPDATDLIRTSAVVLLLGPPATVVYSLLLRDFRYRTASMVRLSRQVVYAITTILLVTVAGLGVWSVILGRVFGAAFELVVVLGVRRPAIRLTFHKEEFLADLPFNAGFLGNRVVDHVGKNIDYWAVGRFLGEARLGVYYIAYVAPNIVRQRVTWAIQATLIPLLSRISNDTRRLKRAWLEGVEKALLIVAPLMVGLILVADPTIRLVFGPRWAAAAGPMRIIAIAAIFDVVLALNGSVFTSIGKPYLSAIGSSARLAIVGGLAVPAAQMGGVEGVALAVMLGSVLAMALTFGLLRKQTGADTLEFFRAIRPTILPVAAMILSVVAVRAVLAGAGALVELLILIPVGIVTYLGAGFAVHRDSFLGVANDLRGLLFNPSREEVLE